MSNIEQQENLTPRSDIEGRNESYAGMTIGEALILIGSRRGESKKERARLEALLEKRGVTKKTTIKEAREVK